jgi:hypothetical protein
MYQQEPSAKGRVFTAMKKIKFSQVSPSFEGFGGICLLVLTAALSTSNFAAAAEPQAPAASSPVLVELFTSEGCSSCPPADEILRKLDSMQPIAGAQAIVLSEHVDYWDHDGWRDVYSQSFFTQRQTFYESRLNVSQGPYTPQMIVDGTYQLNGSNTHDVREAIEKARTRTKIPVRISAVSMLNPKELNVHLEIDGLPADSKAKKADVFVAVALDHAQSHVLQGENKGRDISHVAVVESLNKVGSVEKGKRFSKDVVVKIKPSTDLANLRLIAFVQAPDEGEVVGVSLLSSPIKMSTPVGVATPAPTGGSR